MKKPVKNLFKTWLVQLREEANLTQKQFADFFGVSVGRMMEPTGWEQERYGLVDIRDFEWYGLGLIFM